MSSSSTTDMKKRPIADVHDDGDDAGGRDAKNVVSPPDLMMTSKAKAKATTTSPLSGEEMKEAADPLALTEGAAEKISLDYYTGRNAESNKVMMQVVDIACLKYQYDYHKHHTKISPSLSATAAGAVSRQAQLLPFAAREAAAEAAATAATNSLRADNCHDGMRFYRLILSDGKKVAPAKFFPEYLREYGLRCLSGDGYMQEAIENDSLFKDKDNKLVKGSIIEFYPENYIASGKGIATMKYVEVVGRGPIPQVALTPHHGGALSFSPKDSHQCCIPLSDLRKRKVKEMPIPVPHRVLSYLLQNKGVENVIAGGAALAQYLQDPDDIRGCKFCYNDGFANAVSKADSNDVDLFLPHSSEALEHFRKTGEKMTGFMGHPPEPDFENHLNEALQELSDLGFTHTKIERTKTEIDDDEGEPYGFLRMMLGIEERIDFKFRSPTGRLIKKPVQIIVVNAYPKVGQSWSDFIVGNFDADIVKCSASPGPLGSTMSINISKEVKANIHKGVFQYTIRPLHSYIPMMKRLKKYTDRGFQLTNIRFDPRISDVWKKHILIQFPESFRGAFPRPSRQFIGTDPEGGNGAKEKNKELLQDELIRLLDAVGWVSPGNAKISKSHLFRRFGRMPPPGMAKEEDDYYGDY